MKKITFIILLNFYYPMLGQELQSDEYVIAVAELIDIHSTGKRHDSHTFTFRIKEVLKGATRDTVFTTQEIFNGGGASCIFRKTNSLPYEDKSLQSNSVIIKYKTSGRFPLKWIAEKDRRLSLESLETLLETYAKKNNFKGNYNMLTELDGKLFFGEDYQLKKVAVESIKGSNHWIITTLPTEKD
ncbi:hypothetical protein ACWGOQ_0022595 [Aquimarina sp. M1]